MSEQKKILPAVALRGMTVMPEMVYILTSAVSGL